MTQCVIEDFVTSVLENVHNTVYMLDEVELKSHYLGFIPIRLRNIPYSIQVQSQKILWNNANYQKKKKTFRLKKIHLSSDVCWTFNHLVRLNPTPFLQPASLHLPDMSPSNQQPNETSSDIFSLR